MDLKDAATAQAVSVDGSPESSPHLEAQAPSARHTFTKVSATVAVLVSGLALFSDGYNAQIIGYMEPLLQDLYPTSIDSVIQTRLANAYLIGEIVGMLFFGVLIDRIGRRNGVVLATLFLVLGVVLTTAAHGTTDLGMFWMMIVGRGVAGFGAGGEYPVCATSASEAADETAHVRKRRGILVAASTCFSIDFGFVGAGIVALIVLAAYRQQSSVGIWRICLGLGFVLPVALLFFRLRLVNSTQFRKHKIQNQIPYWLILKRYWRPMLGTSLAWFFYDFVTYPFSIFSSTIIGTLNPANTPTQNIGWGTLINACYLPGCLVGGLLMDRIGARRTMVLGFVLWALVAFILGGALGPIQSIFPLFIVLYCIFSALGEVGPGVATFVCGAESFPTPVRGHFLGLAAAVGKAGAAIGTQVFKPIQASFGDASRGTQAVFLIGAAFALTGAVVSWVLIPERDREMEVEDTRFRSYLAEHGFEGTFGADGGVEPRDAGLATLPPAAKE